MKETILINLLDIKTPGLSLGLLRMTLCVHQEETLFFINLCWDYYRRRGRAWPDWRSDSPVWY